LREATPAPMVLPETGWWHVDGVFSHPTESLRLWRGADGDSWVLAGAGRSVAHGIGPWRLSTAGRALVFDFEGRRVDVERFTDLRASGPVPRAIAALPRRAGGPGAPQ